MQKLCSTDKNVDSSPWEVTFAKHFDVFERWGVAAQTNTAAASQIINTDFPKQAPVNLSAIMELDIKKLDIKKRHSTVHTVIQVIFLSLYSLKLEATRKFQVKLTFYSERTHFFIPGSTVHALFLNTQYYLHCKYIRGWEDSSSWRWGWTCRLQSGPHGTGIPPPALLSTAYS